MKYVLIDMGSSRISIMAVEMTENGEVRVLSEESKKSDEIKYGIVGQASKCAYTINELTKLLQNSSRLSEINKICISLNAKTMKLVSVRINRSLGFGKTITDELLNEMRQECKAKFNHSEIEVFDIIPHYYELDGIKTDNPVDERASDLSAFYNVIVGNIDIKEELQRCFDRTLNISTDNFMPLGMEALSAVLLSDDERAEGCALINFGATTTTLAIYADGVLQHLLVVPLGGKNITKDIQELGMSEANAEKLKCLKGSALKRLVDEPVRIQIPSTDEENPPIRIATNFLATIIEARLSEIMTPILIAIDKTPFDLNAGIVITGGGSKLNNIVDFLEEKTDMEVRFGNHSDWLSDDSQRRFSDPIYAQLIGTAVLLHEHKSKHPENEQSVHKESEKRGANNQKTKFTDKIKDKISNRFLKLFEDENYLK